MFRTRPSRTVRTASSNRAPMPKVRTKSRPVPRGMIASSGPTTSAIPLTTSFTVPSPPTATSSSYSCAARAASSVISPGLVDSSTSPFSPSRPARCASSGQRRPVEPAAEAGLTRKTVLVLVGGDRLERDPRHPVDRGLQLLVRDAREDALDHDVRHRQQAPRLDAAQRRDREQRRRLHLDGEDAAPRPALVLALVRVVEEVAGDDRPV